MEEKMTIEERYQYLHRMKKRYIKANRKERGRLLCTEKNLIRLPGTDLKQHPRARERGPSYGSIIAWLAQATLKH